MVWTGGGPVEKEQDKKAVVSLRSIRNASSMHFCGHGCGWNAFR